MDRDLQRRHVNGRVDELLGELREPAATTKNTFDARTAKPEEVEARLAKLTSSASADLAAAQPRLS